MSSIKSLAPAFLLFLATILPLIAPSPAAAVPPATPGTTARGDVNGDGVEDVARLQTSGRQVRVLTRFGSPGRSFGADRWVTELPDLRGIEIIDVDGDGAGEVRLVDRWHDAHFYRLQDDGSFRLMTDSEVQGEPAPTPAALVTDDPLQWRQQSDGRSSYSSVRSSQQDREVADDFFLEGQVTGLIAFGRQGFPAPPESPVEAVEVRFYGVTPDGKPGAVQAEYILEPGNEDLVIDPLNPGNVEVTLSPPFPATGRHFVGVQVVVDSVWYRPSANTLPQNVAVRGSHFWVKDEFEDGTWEPYQNSLGNQIADLTLELYGDLTAPPGALTVTPGATNPSGRLRIGGYNLSGARNGGSVTVGGLPALVAEWTDREIHAYVPEGIDGAADVVVQNAVGPSDPRTIQVSPRTQQGHVQWRFTCDSRYVRHRVGIGPDGTIYAQDVEAIVYALSPDGALLWLRDLAQIVGPSTGSEGPVVVGADGTIFVGVNPLGGTSMIFALNPDGSTRWTYTKNDSQGLIAGPGVGPDGNVYAAFDFPDPAVVSLNPGDGSVRWTHPGDPAISENGQRGIEIGFGEDRFYLAFDEAGVHPISLLYAFSYGGQQLYSIGRPAENAYPVVGPDGSVYLPIFPSGSGLRLGSYNPGGDVAWAAFESPTNVLTNPDVGPEGNIYIVRNLHELHALDPEGSILWTTKVTDNYLYRPIASPDGKQVLAGGLIPGNNYPVDRFGYFRAFDDTGELLWTEVLPQDPDGAVLSADAGPRFRPDGTAAYAPVGRNFNNDIDPHCYIYALDTSDTTPGNGGGEPTGPAGIFGDGFETGDDGMWTP